MKPATFALLVLVLDGCGGQGTPAAAPPAASGAAASPSLPPPAPPAADAGAPRGVPPTPSASPSAQPAPSAGESKPAPGAPPAASAAPPEPPPRSPLAGAMREHFKDTETIRAAVIHGPLSNAVVPARALVDLAGSGHMPDNWKRWAERVKEISVRISASPDVSATAAATADIGVTCGGCHRGGGGPKLKLGQPPALGTTLASRMARHAWATERLWEGLYAPSDAAWKAGAAALEGSEFPAEILKQGGVHARSAATRFAAVVAKAKDQKTPEDRAAAYGSLIETCASCHIALGKSH